MGPVPFLEAGVILAACFHVIAVPYTKVEESFSLQAIHDVLAFGLSPSAKHNYDHVTFPGAVPRSFVGPILLAIASYPLLVVGKLTHLVHSSAHAQLVVRLVLAVVSAGSVVHFARLVFLTERSIPYTQRKYVRMMHIWFLLSSALQFHFIFWSGRTTPNGMVMPFVVLSLGLVLGHAENGRVQCCLGISLLTACAVIARLEIVGLLAPVFLYAGFTGRAASDHKTRTASHMVSSFAILVMCGMGSGFLALCTTLAIDSYLWNRPMALWNIFDENAERGILWPEFESIVFNVVEGKSADWGTSPWHAYLTQHIPKLVSVSLLLLVLGVVCQWSVQCKLVRRRHTLPVGSMMLVCGVHVAIMSTLGHKETRFISYLTPLLNVVAAQGAAELWSLTTWRFFGRLTVLVLVGLQVLLTSLSLTASSGNYPGGEALAQLHRSFHSSSSAVAHIDVLPAMTGVSRFQSIYANDRPDRGSLGFDFLPCVLCPPEGSPRWNYDKTEDIFAEKTGGIRHPSNRRSSVSPSSLTFNYLISDSMDCHVPGTYAKVCTEETDAKHSDSPPFQCGFSEFSHIQRKPVQSVWKAISQWKDIHSFSDFVRTLLPFTLVWNPVVWICENRSQQ